MPVTLLEGLQALKNNGATGIKVQGETRNIYDEIQAVADNDLDGWTTVDWALEDGRELYRLNDSGRPMFDGTHVSGIFNN
jgi:hypothetical protein